MTSNAAAAHVRDVLFVTHSLHKLAPDELAVVCSVVEGLLQGKRTYGDLDLSTDPRHWQREALEELRDGLVYLTCQLLTLAPPPEPIRWPGS